MSNLLSLNGMSHLTMNENLLNPVAILSVSLLKLNMQILLNMRISLNLDADILNSVVNLSESKLQMTFISSMLHLQILLNDIVEISCIILVFKKQFLITLENIK